MGEESLAALLGATAKRTSAGAEFLETLVDLAEEGHDTSLLAAAHLACAVVDGRHLLQAARRYLDADNLVGLQQVLEIALRRGQIRVVAELRRTGIAELAVPDYAAWLRTKGLPYFDLYRDHDASLSFICDADAELLRQEAASTGDSGTLFAQALRGLHPGFPAERRSLLEKVAATAEPLIQTPPSHRVGIDRRFREACAQRGASILRIFQDPRLGGEQPRGGVYLVHDSDGIAKVYKEVLSADPRRPLDLEAEAALAERLTGLDFVPRLHGIDRLGEVSFRKMSMLWGQPLLDFVRDGRHASVEDACSLVGQLARALAVLEERGVLYLDLRPQNVLVHPDGIRLLDIDSTQLVDEPGAWVGSHLYDARYAPPEVILQQRALAASSSYQLGVLFHQLLTGEHPFDRGAGLLVDETDPETMLLRFALPSTVLRYRGALAGHGDRRLGLVERMLDPDPDERPTLAELAARLEPRHVQVSHPARKPATTPRPDNTVLFPARMGIPHRGHIDFCERVLEMGFHLHIALSRAYTITQRDPYPKHLVMKMVARSLFDLGFHEDDFSVTLTPFYATDAELRLHFSMMPGRVDMVAVASGSPDTAAVFGGLAHFEQACVFGIEGDLWENRSWGAMLRAAVREGDRGRFEELVATGVESILSFEDLRARYAEQEVEFVSRVTFVVEDETGERAAGRVRRYATPQESIARKLSRLGHRARIVDLYARDSVIELDGDRLALVHGATQIEEDRAILRFQLRPLQR